MKKNTEKTSQIEIKMQFEKKKIWLSHRHSHLKVKQKHWACAFLYYIKGTKCLQLNSKYFRNKFTIIYNIGYKYIHLYMEPATKKNEDNNNNYNKKKWVKKLLSGNVK